MNAPVRFRSRQHAQAAKQAQAGLDLTEKQKTGMLAKLDSEIPAAEKGQPISDEHVIRGEPRR
jgi:hypothetical protein